MSNNLSYAIWIDINDYESIRVSIDVPETLSDCLRGNYLALKSMRRWKPTQRVYVTNR